MRARNSLVAVFLAAFTVLPLTAVAESGRTLVAVFDFSGETVGLAERRLLAERLGFELEQTGNFEPVAKALLDSLIAERGLHAGECTTSDCGIEIGRIVGARQVVVASIARHDSSHAVSARLINVATGRVDRFAAKECTCPLALVIGGVLSQVARELAASEDDVRSDPLGALASRGARQPAGAGSGRDGQGQAFSPSKGFSIGASGLVPAGDLDIITDYGGSLSVRYFPGEEAKRLREGAQFDLLFWSGPLHEIALAGQYVVGYVFANPASKVRPFGRAGVGLARRYSLSGSSPEHNFSKRDFGFLDVAYQFGGGVEIGRLHLIVERQAIANWSWVSIGLAYGF